MKMRVGVCALILSFAVVLVAVLSVAVGPWHSAAKGNVVATREGGAKSPRACASPLADEKPVYHYPVDPRTREELRRVYDGIAVAYSNRQTAVMRRIFSEVRDRIRSLTDEDFKYVKHCAYGAYDDALFVQRGKCRTFRPPDDFTDVAVFRRYADALLELVRITADADIARKGHGVGNGIEALPLRLLKEYRKKFGEEGRRELEACADRLIAEWVAFIESDAGYSHAYARHIFPRNLRIHEQDGHRREDAVMITRLCASMELEQFGGYTPKWLDEIK